MLACDWHYAEQARVESFRCGIRCRCISWTVQLVDGERLDTCCVSDVCPFPLLGRSGILQGQLPFSLMPCLSNFDLKYFTRSCFDWGSFSVKMQALPDDVKRPSLQYFSVPASKPLRYFSPARSFSVVYGAVFFCEPGDPKGLPS